jgi:hypothetical protein
MEKEKSFWDVLISLDKWQIFIIVIVIVILYFISKYDTIIGLIKNKKKIKILSEEESKLLQIKKEKEAIMAEVERVKKEIAENRLKNIEASAHQAVEVLTGCIGANYYLVHDSGKHLSLTDNWFMTILRSTSFNLAIDFEHPVALEEGFRWLNTMGRDRFFYVIDDMEKEKHFTQGEKDYMSLMGIRSACVMVVRNEGSRIHMASFNFEHTNPLKNNPELRKIAMGFKRAILANI